MKMPLAQGLVTSVCSLCLGRSHEDPLIWQRETMALGTLWCDSGRESGFGLKKKKSVLHSPTKLSLKPMQQ